MSVRWRSYRSADSRHAEPRDVDGGAAVHDHPQAGRAGGVPTGQGGSQDREWYRGIPVPEHAVSEFTRRNNANYMQTGVLVLLFR